MSEQTDFGWDATGPEENDSDPGEYDSDSRADATESKVDASESGEGASGTEGSASEVTGDESPRRKIWSVSELVDASRDAVERAHPFVWVRGEISNFKAHTSGHWYFNLKDEDAVLAAVMFRGNNRAVPFDVEDGLEALAGGRPTIYRRWGRFQIIVELLEPMGWGALQLAYEQLKRKLDAEGLLDPSRKRPLPILPRCVGVVTSESGAAWKDMYRVWSRRQVGLRVILAPTPVQGDEAADRIASALRALVEHGDAEVVILGRGGGSREDLWAFNEEVVARAIAASEIPIVSAVGHEIDTTISDLVADRRAATPTAAAEIVAPSRDELTRRMEGALRQIRGTVSSTALRARNRLESRDLQRKLRRPALLLSRHQQRLDEVWDRVEAGLRTVSRERRSRLERAARDLTQNTPLHLAHRRRRRLDRALRVLDRAMTATVNARRERLGSLAARVKALSPLAVLGRGYAICQRREDGAVVRAVADVDVDDDVEVRLERGRLDCRVISLDPHAGAATISDEGPGPGPESSPDEPPSS